MRVVNICYVYVIFKNLFYLLNLRNRIMQVQTQKKEFEDNKVTNQDVHNSHKYINTDLTNQMSTTLINCLFCVLSNLLVYWIFYIHNYIFLVFQFYITYMLYYLGMLKVLSKTLKIICWKWLISNAYNFINNSTFYILQNRVIFKS